MRWTRVRLCETIAAVQAPTLVLGEAEELNSIKHPVSYGMTCGKEEALV